MYELRGLFYIYPARQKRNRYWVDVVEVIDCKKEN